MTKPNPFATQMVPAVPSSFRDHHQAQEGQHSGYGAAGWPSKKGTHRSPTASLHAHPSPYALSDISREETRAALLVWLYGEGWQSPASDYAPEET